MLYLYVGRLEEVQEIIGHEDSDITRKIYLHFHPEDKRESINKLNYLFSSKKLSRKKVGKSNKFMRLSAVKFFF